MSAPLPPGIHQLGRPWVAEKAGKPAETAADPAAPEAERLRRLGIWPMGSRPKPPGPAQAKDQAMDQAPAQEQQGEERLSITRRRGPMSEAQKEKLRASALRSWRSGKRRKRRTRAELREERLAGILPWRKSRAKKPKAKRTRDEKGRFKRTGGKGKGKTIAGIHFFGGNPSATPPPPPSAVLRRIV